MANSRDSSATIAEIRRQHLEYGGWPQSENYRVTETLLAHIDALESRECAPCEKWIRGPKTGALHDETYGDGVVHTRFVFCPWCGGRVKQ